MGGQCGGLSRPAQVGRHSITWSKRGPRKNGIAKRLRPTGGKARCGVDRKRLLLQRRSMSPELTAKEPGRYGTSSQSADGRRTCKPGISVCARKVIKLLSVCGAMPNWLASAATGG